MELKNTPEQMELTNIYIFKFHSIAAEYKFFQGHIQNSPGQILDRKQISENLRRLKSYQLCFLTTWYKTRNQQQKNLENLQIYRNKTAYF